MRAWQSFSSLNFPILVLSGTLLEKPGILSSTLDDREIFNIEGYSVSKVPHGTYLVIIAIIKMVKTKLMFEPVTVISNRVPLTLQWYIIYKTLVKLW